MTPLERRPGRSRSFASALLFALVAACGSESPEALVSSAKEYSSKSDFKAASIQLKNALQLKPDDAEARFLLGVAEHRNGDLPAAEKELRRARDLGYPEDQVVPLLARVLLEQGQAGKVVSEFGPVALTSPEAKASLLVSLGSAHLMLGKLDEARQAFEQAMQAKRDLPEVMLAQVRMKAIDKKLPEAEALLGEVLSKWPELLEALFLKAQFEATQGRIPEAVGTYEKILSLKPHNLQARTAIFFIHLQDKRVEDAGAQLAELKKVSPQDPRVLYLDALYAYLQRDTARARESVQQVLRLVPNHPQSNLLAGMLAYHGRSYAQAEAHLLKVLERAPRQPAARRILSSVYLSTGRPDKAIEVIGPALAAVPNDPGVQLAAGEAYMAANELEKAEEHFEKAARLNEQDPAAKSRLGVARIAQGEVDEGFRELEIASRLDETDVKADWVIVLSHLRRRDADAALKALASLEQKMPGRAATHNVRAAALLLKNDRAGARKSLEQALELDPAYVPAVVNLAKLDIGEKRPEAAHQRFAHYLEKNPKNVAALLAFAQLKAQTGAPAKEVLALIQSAVAADPSSPAARARLIAHHLVAKEPPAALAAARDAHAAMPDRPEILELLGAAQQASGDVNQAIASFRRLEVLAPSSPVPHMRLAALYLSAKDSNGALESFKKALRVQPDLAEARRGVIALHVKEGRIKEALSVAAEAQARHPDQSLGYLLEGDIHISQKQWNRAAEVFANGLKQAPRPELAIRLHQSLQQAGKASEAERFVTKWVKEHPKDAAVRQYLGQRATFERRYEVAAEHFQAVLKLQPENAVALNNLAWVEGRLKSPQALEHAEKAHALAPDNPAILDTLGVLLLEAGRTEQGVAHLQDAATRAPNSPSIRLNYAKALIAAGRKDAARKELEAVLGAGEGFAGREEAAGLLKSL